MCRTDFVDDVDGLVGQLTVVDVFRTQLGSGLDRFVRVNNTVVLFKAALQAFEDGNGLLHRGLNHVHFLKAPRQRCVFFENTAVLVERGGTDALERARAQAWFKQIGGVHRPARGSSRTNHGVDFIDEQNGLGLGRQGLEHALQALLEITTVLGARNERAHVQGVNDSTGENRRHFFLHNAPCQSLGNGGLANPSFAHKQGIVFAAPAKNLNGSLDFVFASNKGVDFSLACCLVQIDGVQRQGGALLAWFGGIDVAGGLGIGLFATNAMLNEIQDVIAGCPALIKETHCVRFFFAKHRGNHMRASDLHFAAAVEFHLHQCPLDNALHTERMLHVIGRVFLDVLVHARSAFLHEAVENFGKGLDVNSAGLKHFGGMVVFKEFQQEQFNGDAFVTLVGRFFEGGFQGELKIGVEHGISMSL